MPDEIDPMVQSVLDTIAGNLRIQLGSPSVLQPGQALTASITPFPQSIPTIRLIQAPFSLDALLNPATVNGQDDRITHISKKVQYANPDPEPSLTNTALNGAITSVQTPIILPNASFATVTGFSGLLDQITIPHLVGDLDGWIRIPLPIQVPITANITWKVVKIVNNAEVPLTAGTDYLAPQGLNTFTPSFIIRPPIVTNPTQTEPAIRYLQATLTLSADTYTTKPIAIPRVELRVLPLPLPLSLLFRLSLDNMPQPGLPTNISLVRTAENAPNIPDIFDLTWQTINTNPAKLPIPLGVKWEFLKDSGNGQREVLSTEEAQHVQTLTDIARPPLSLLIQPNIVEMANDQPPINLVLPDTIYVRASIGLADSDPATWVQLPELPLPVPTIAIPTLLALFNHEDFSLNDRDGTPPCALVIMPTNSLLRTANVEEVLNALRGLLTAITQLSKLPTKLPIVSKLIDMLGPLGQLVNTLAALSAITDPGYEKGPKLVLRTTNEEKELHDILFYNYTIVDKNYSAEDSLSSLIFIGPPGKSLRLYNDTHFKEGQGAFSLRLPDGELLSFVAVIESLDDDRPKTFPEAAYIPQHAAEHGSFDDRLSSFKFLPNDWLQVAIEDFEPKSGPVGTEVVVDIEGFIDTLELNGTRVDYRLDWSHLLDRKVRFTVPEGASSGKIKARFRDLAAETEAAFTVTSE